LRLTWGTILNPTNHISDFPWHLPIVWMGFLPWQNWNIVCNVSEPWETKKKKKKTNQHKHSLSHQIFEGHISITFLCSLKRKGIRISINVFLFMMWPWF
jgi:hypothetical protein